MLFYCCIYVPTPLRLCYSSYMISVFHKLITIYQHFHILFLMFLPLCNTPDRVKPKLDGHVRVTWTSLELIILLKVWNESVWTCPKRMRMNEALMELFLLRVSPCISVNICCFLTEMNRFHVLIS